MPQTGSDVVTGKAGIAASPQAQEIGVGPTADLSLRVSVAALVRITFEHPQEGWPALALERVATLRQSQRGPCVRVMAQPFGGAVRILNPTALARRIGPFHFDSQRSRSERDVRIQVRPAAWKTLQRLCLEQYRRADGTILETGPERELTEELADALDVRISREQVGSRPIGLLVEDEPAPTENVRATGSPTVRVYFAYEVRLLDPQLIAALVGESARHTDDDLRELALRDARRGGKGRANGVLILPLTSVVEAYRALPADARASTITVAGHRLHSNVPAVLEGVHSPKFQVMPGGNDG
jgi:hypothetical protein